MFGKKLVIISHTAHQILPNGEVVGWGPTVTEINHLAQHWDEIIHIACIEEFSDNKSYQPYLAKNIHFKSIPSFGGKTIMSKLGVLIKAPRIIITILKNLQDSSHVQIRVPMGIGLYVLPLFLFIPRKFVLWVKYANNWGNVSSSLVYRFQRWFLNRNYLNCKVTINGFWPDQPKHCLSFENPCISESQFHIGQQLSKDFNSKVKVIFIGRLEIEKGIQFVLDVIGQINKDRFEEWIFVGDGKLSSKLKEKFGRLKINHRFVGFVNQEKVHEELSKAHLLLLPSLSEGFPKVVAEAWNYKVIPIVSPVGSLPNYLKNQVNGFMMHTLDTESLYKIFKFIEDTDESLLKSISEEGNKMALKFTFKNYINKLEREVFI